MQSFPTSIEPHGIFDGLKPGAILIGAVVDHVATVATSIVLFALLAGESAFSDDEEVTQAAFDALSADPQFLVWSMVLGLSCTVLGAFVGARRAGKLHLRHGGWVAVASAVIGLLYLLLPAEATGPAPPLWYDVVGWVLLLPSGLLGGALSGALHSRLSGPVDPLQKSR
jgi:hypothetical protein